MITKFNEEEEDESTTEPKKETYPETEENALLPLSTSGFKDFVHKDSRFITGTRKR